MWYVIFSIAATVWAYRDSSRRKTNTILWTTGVALLAPIILPIYLARRPLKDGEVREGGVAWNMIKNFAVLWTLLLVAAAAWNIASMSYSIAQSEATEADIGIMVATFGEIGKSWFHLLIGAFIIGLFLKKSSVIEKGPTGPLVVVAEQENDSGG